MDSHDKVSQLRKTIAQKKDNEKKNQEQLNALENLSIGMKEKYENEISDLKKQIAQLESEKLEAEKKAKEANEKFVRNYAEMENYRKRVAKEKDELRQYGAEKIFQELLPVLDSMEKALEHAEEKEPNVKEMIAGVELVNKQLLQALEKFGLKPIQAQGQVFDPNFHEAISQQESNQYAPDTVLAEHRRGYQLHQRVLRPAMVTVTKSS